MGHRGGLVVLDRDRGIGCRYREVIRARCRCHRMGIGAIAKQVILDEINNELLVDFNNVVRGDRNRERLRIVQGGAVVGQCHGRVVIVIGAGVGVCIAVGCAGTAVAVPGNREGTNAIGLNLGIQLENVQLSDLGSAKKLIVDKDNTTVIEGGGDSKDIKARIDQIRRELENSTSDYDREKLEERIAKLSGGVAQVNVGAATETEMKEKKALVEDALHATRAAVEEGIVPGGGVALIRAQSSLADMTADAHDEQVGIDILRRALEAPIRQIATNAGADGSIVAAKVREGKDAFGFNALTDEYEDLVKSGVIDPTKVVRSALQNAASIAGLLLTTEAVVVEQPEETPAAPPMPGGGMDGMY